MIWQGIKYCLLIFICLGLTISQASSSSEKFGEAVGMVTGSKGGAYYPIGKDIAKFAKRYGVNVWARTSNGSIDNIRKMMSRGTNASFAIVQSDILQYLKRKNDDPELQATAGKLRLIFPLYDEEVHLLAKKNIRTLSDLKGKRVYVGTPDSGTFMTATTILRKLGINVHKVYDGSPKEGLKRLLDRNELDALFYVGGKPLGYFSMLTKAASANDILKKNLNKVHFIPLNDKRLYTEYQVARIDPSDYQHNGFSLLKQSVPTVSVQAMLVSFNFHAKSRTNAYHRTRCQQIAFIKYAIRKHLPDLKNKKFSYHPKWREVNLNESIASWPIDRCNEINIPPEKPKGNQCNSVGSVLDEKC